MKLIPINKTNNQLVNKIKGKPDQLHLVHYNAHWYGQSQLQEDIHFLLAQVANEYVGVICFGQYYKDAYLQEKEQGVGEVIHVVVDAKHQGQGHSKAMANLAITSLKEEGYSKIYVATVEENTISMNLWKKLGFQSTGLSNYDGDPIFELTGY